MILQASGQLQRNHYDLYFGQVLQNSFRLPAPELLFENDLPQAVIKLIASPRLRFSDNRCFVVCCFESDVKLQWLCL